MFSDSDNFALCEYNKLINTRTQTCDDIQTIDSAWKCGRNEPKITLDAENVAIIWEKVHVRNGIKCFELIQKYVHHHKEFIEKQ